MKYHLVDKRHKDSFTFEKLEDVISRAWYRSYDSSEDFIKRVLYEAVEEKADKISFENRIIVFLQYDE